MAVEHRVTWELGESGRQEGWLAVATFPRGQYNTPPSGWAYWFDHPEEIFASNDLRTLRMYVGGNAKPSPNWFLSPTTLRVQVFDARSVAVQLRRCAERHIERGLLEGSQERQSDARFASLERRVS